MFRLSGIPGALTKRTQIRVNGVDITADDMSRTRGSYAALESFNSNYLEKHHPDDDSGNLYRCTYYEWAQGGDENRTDADFTYHGENPTAYNENYIKKTNE